MDYFVADSAMTLIWRKKWSNHWLLHFAVKEVVFCVIRETQNDHWIGFESCTVRLQPGPTPLPSGAEKATKCSFEQNQKQKSIVQQQACLKGGQKH